MAELAQYRDLFAKLLPSGLAWNQKEIEGEPLYQMLLAMAEEPALLDAMAVGLLAEMNPAQAISLLPDWEADLGLPDECFASLTSIGARQSLAFQRWTATGTATLEGLQGLVRAAGFADVTLAEHWPLSASCVGSCTAPLYSDGWAFVFYVYSTSSPVLDVAKCTDPCTVALRELGGSEVECLVNRYKPAHTIPVFVYS